MIQNFYILSKRLLLTFALLLSMPLPAYALPTPDALISVANILPLLTGAVVTALGGVYYTIRKVLGPQAGGLIIGGVFGGFIVLLGLLILVAYNWNESNRTQRVNNITMYLRCDIAGHEAYIRWNKGNKGAKKEWAKYGAFTELSLKDVGNQLRQQPDATLIATPRRSIQYHSGIPGVEVDGKIKLFDFVREKELLSYIKTNVHTRDLYLHDFYRNYKRSPEKYAKDLAQMKVFEKFEHIYITKSSGAYGRYVVEDNGLIRAANPAGGAIEWPVRNEPWIIDNARARFPNMLTLLPDDDAVDFIEDEDIYLVAPYNSFQRHSYNQIETYLERLLFDISAERVLILDMSAPNISDILRRLALKLDGKKFMVIGLTKYDWVYDGLDVSFELWERLAHDTERFKLQGFTTRLPEVSAIRFEAVSTQGTVDLLREPFWQSIIWLRDTLRVSTAMAVILFAILLRLLFSPIGILEARSRFMRTRIKHALKQQTRPLWGGSEQALMHHLKVRGVWELLGTMVMLALILPAYSILSAPPAGIFEQGFLWIKQLTEPDIWLSLIVSAMIYFKIQISGSEMKQFTALMMTAVFALLLLSLPSSLLLYVFGVLLVTTTQELFALRYSRRLMNRALLKAS